MPPSFTPAVARAVARASLLARGTASSEVLPAHLLQALLSEEEGQAATLAVAHGLNLPAWVRGLPPAVEGEMLPHSRVLEEVLEDARALAAELTGDRTVSGEAALHALAGIPELAASMVERGLDLAALRSSIESGRLPPPVVEDALRLDDATEKVDTARILDASANRAREALRVLEDHARFALDDSFLAGLAKGLRHELTQALRELGPTGLLEARDTLADVGTRIGGSGEYERRSLADVLAAAARRLGEALRSLEEYGKLAHPLLGERMERIRYQGYTLERALSLGAKARERLADARLYVLLTGATCAASLEWTIGQAADGGASIVQLREKTLPDRELLARARDVRRWTRQAGVLFIVNDRPDIARLCEADGVHLGQDDMTAKDARRILGPEALVGVSTHDEAQVRQAVLDGASYIGVGPTFVSGTKAFDAFPGLDFVRKATALTALPAFAIGGIHAGNVEQVRQAGARRVAVSLAVAAADDPRAAAMGLVSALGGS